MPNQWTGGEGRGRVLTLRVTEEEYALWSEAAARIGQPMSAYIRSTMRAVLTPTEALKSRRSRREP